MKANLSSLAEVLAAQRRASRPTATRKKTTTAATEPAFQPSATASSTK